MAAEVDSLLWTDKELAQALGTHRRTIWRWAATGEIPAPIHIGGKTCWRRQEIEELLARKAEAAEREHKKNQKAS